MLLVLGASQAALAAYVYPYYLAYYNPLLGGGPAARRTFVVGWGEGLDIVTDYLNTKPDAERLTVAGFYPRVMSAQFKGTVLSDKQYDAAMADYIVLYVNAVQRDLANRLRMVTRGKRSEMVVKINGIEYARLYAVPPPPRRNAAGTEFGRQVRMERAFLKSDERPYLKSDDLNPGDTIEETIRWVVLQPTSRGSRGGRSDARPEGHRRGRARRADRRRREPDVDDAPERHRDRGAPDRAAERHRGVQPAGRGASGRAASGLRSRASPERLDREALRYPSRVVVDSVDAR